MMEMVSKIEEFAKRNDISKEDALQLTVDECKRKWKIKEDKKEWSIPPVEACALLYNMNLSKLQYQMMRTICLKYGFEFPTQNTIDQLKRTFHPPIKSFQLKAMVDIKSLLEETASSLMTLHVNKEELNGSFLMVGKFGVDGSGSHKIRQQIVDESLAMGETPHLDITKTGNFLLSC